MAIFRTVTLTAFVTIALSGWCDRAATAQLAEEAVKRFDNSIVGGLLPDGSVPAANALEESVRKKATLEVQFSLATRNIKELQARVAKGERIPPKRTPHIVLRLRKLALLATDVALVPLVGLDECTGHWVLLLARD
jgi:hypothetical protein